MADSAIDSNDPRPSAEIPSSAPDEPSQPEQVTMEDNPFMRIMGRLIYAEACRYDYR